jgi:prolyl-tRNA synthetase
MGCYGIGISRLVQSCIEVNHIDKLYPNWPLEIVPFQVAIIPSKKGSKEEEKSNVLVEYLCDMLDKNVHFKDDVLVDDRQHMTIGSRLIDAKLIGIPYCVVLGRSIHEEQVEICLMSPSIQKAAGDKQKIMCHTRELAHVLKQLNDDYFYVKKQNKLNEYFK